MRIDFLILIIYSLSMMENEVILWPFMVYFTLVIIIVFAMIGISYILGQRHMEKETGEPYESGIASFGSARLRFNVNFFAIAVMFLIFDLESVFIYVWSVSVRESGWNGYLLMLVFILVLAAALVYLWRMGVLDIRSKKTHGMGWVKG